MVAVTDEEYLHCRGCIYICFKFRNYPQKNTVHAKLRIEQTERREKKVADNSGH